MVKVKIGYVKCPYCIQQYSNLQWLMDHIRQSHPRKAKEQGLDRCI